MKKAIKIVCVVLLFACSCIFTSIYIISDDISENYKLNRGDELEINTFMPVTVVYDKAASSQGTAIRQVGDSFEVNLKLFGIIPFSKTRVQIVDEMHVQVLGEPFGMKIYTDGVLVVDSVDIQTKSGKKNPAASAGIKIGDYIKSINGKTVTCNEDVLELVTKSNGKAMKFEVMRDNKTFCCNVKPALDKESNIYRIGIWVRDSSAGVGTLTFYSPSNDVVCGLGHGVCDTDTNELLEIESGELVKAEIIDVEKGSAGSPGSLKGKLSYDSIADISLNCECGIYGVVKSNTASQKLTEIAMKQDVKNGNAQILCTVEGNKPKLYSCRIKKVGKSDSQTQNLIVTVTDEELINVTGGIVQGMSGSPILQNGKLVGALTHVLVDDPIKGYAIFAENMLETAKGVAEEQQMKDAS